MENNNFQVKQNTESTSADATRRIKKLYFLLRFVKQFLCYIFW